MIREASRVWKPRKVNKEQDHLTNDNRQRSRKTSSIVVSGASESREWGPCHFQFLEVSSSEGVRVLGRQQSKQLKNGDQVKDLVSTN